MNNKFIYSIIVLLGGYFKLNATELPQKYKKIIIPIANISPENLNYKNQIIAQNILYNHSYNKITTLTDYEYGKPIELNYDEKNDLIDISVFDNHIVVIPSDEIRQYSKNWVSEN